MFHGRKRLATALSGLALAATVGMVGLVPAQPAQAEPDIDDVQARVDTLFHEAEQASERLNDAKLELAELRRDVVSLQADQDRQDTQLEARSRGPPGLDHQPVRRPEPLRPRRRSPSPTTPTPSSPASRRCRRTTTCRRSSSTPSPPRPRRSTSASKATDAARRGGPEEAGPARCREEDDRHQARGGQGAARPSSRPRSARRCSAGARSGCPPVSTRPAARPPRSATPWPRSATPTSTARPAPTPSTAPA